MWLKEYDKWEMSVYIQQGHNFKNISGLVKWLRALQKLEAKLEALKGFVLLSLGHGYWKERTHLGM